MFIYLLDLISYFGLLKKNRNIRDCYSRDPHETIVLSHIPSCIGREMVLSRRKKAFQPDLQAPNDLLLVFSWHTVAFATPVRARARACALDPSRGQQTYTFLSVGIRCAISPPPCVATDISHFRFSHNSPWISTFLH